MDLLIDNRLGNGGWFLDRVNGLFNGLASELELISPPVDVVEDPEGYRFPATSCPNWVPRSPGSNCELATSTGKHIAPCPLSSGARSSPRCRTPPGRRR